MQLRDIIMSGGVLPAMLKQDQARKDEEEELKKKAAVTQGMNNGGSASSRADGCCTKGKTRGKMC